MTQSAVDKVVAACPRLALADSVKFGFGKKTHMWPAAPWARMDQPITMQDVVGLLCGLGAFEPLSASRPGACDPRMVFDKTIEIPPATIVDGKLVPGTKKLVMFCAPRHRSLVVNVLRGLPANLTAAEDGEVFFKQNQVFGFSEGWCPPGEAEGEETNGTYGNVEHIVLCPGGGFGLNARNKSTLSPALFNIAAEAWSTC